MNIKKISILFVHGIVHFAYNRALFPKHFQYHYYCTSHHCILLMKTQQNKSHEYIKIKLSDTNSTRYRKARK